MQKAPLLICVQNDGIRRRRRRSRPICHTRRNFLVIWILCSPYLCKSATQLCGINLPPSALTSACVSLQMPKYWFTTRSSVTSRQICNLWNAIGLLFYYFFQKLWFETSKKSCTVTYLINCHKIFVYSNIVCRDKLNKTCSYKSIHFRIQIKTYSDSLITTTF